MVAGQRKGFTVNAEHVSYSVLADIFFLEKKIYIFWSFAHSRPELSCPSASQDDKVREEKPAVAAGDVTYLSSDIDRSFAGLHLKITSNPGIEA